MHSFPSGSTKATEFLLCKCQLQNLLKQKVNIVSISKNKLVFVQVLLVVYSLYAQQHLNMLDKGSSSLGIFPTEQSKYQGLIRQHEILG